VSVIATFLLRALIRCYQLLVYAADAILLHGPIRGSALGIARLCRCHPWGGSGLDPVPPLRCEPVTPTSAWPPSSSPMGRS
jgi:hypothetical protein